MTKLVPLVIVLAACGKSNPYYCDDHPDDNCTVDASTTGDGPTACTMSSECGTTAKPVCDDVQGVCVACTASDVGSCGGTTPVCSTTNQCRACTMNADCPSLACMPDGSCAAASATLYVSPTGGATTCMAADKCSLEHAVSIADATRKVIVLDPGAYTTTGTVLITGKELTLLGREAVITRGGASTGAVLSLATSATASVYYATIENGDDDTIGHGIACATSTLVARLVTIRGNDGNGINATGCNVTLDRSTITDNDAGGVFIMGTTHSFSVTNTYFYANGNSTTAAFGGAKISVSAPPSARFEFNTIVDNYALADAANAGGLVCSNFVAANNIIARNYASSDANAANAQWFGSCTHESSKIQPTVDGLAFVDATPPTYVLRIGDASIAKDAATTASPITIDFDGDGRPQHGGKDIGADEFK